MTTLKASSVGLRKIKQAREAKGWTINDFRWLEAASEVLGTSWEETGVLAVGVSEGTWKRFLAGKRQAGWSLPAPGCWTAIMVAWSSASGDVLPFGLRKKSESSAWLV